MRLDSTDLRLFVAIAETGSLSKGAGLVHLSSAGASERLRSLEGRIGKTLFYREPKGLALNLAGETFIRHARVMLRQMDAAKDDLDDLNNDQVGHLRIFANTSAVTEFMPGILGRFMAQRPRVTVDLVERPIREVLRGVTDGSVDFGIVAGIDTPAPLQSIHFATDYMVLAVPDGHALSDAGAVAFADTLAYPHVGLADSSSYGKFMQDIAGQLPKAPQTRIQLRSFEAMCSMITAGVGVGVLPESAAVRYQRTMPLKICRLRDDWALRERKIVTRDLEGLSACAQALIQDILNHFSGHSALPKP
jgi:DNA-binding transcriptional LysR family regulator